MSLDLYAKIEPYIGFYQDYERLYSRYLGIIKKLKPATILDVGCGNGRMLEILETNGYDAKGIDISAKMVEIAKKRGVKAEHKDISRVKEKYDVVIAVADVLNYMDEDALEGFLGYIQNALSHKGIFVCDINTLHGFSDIADGTLLKDDSDVFLAIDAVFDGQILDTYITFFEKDKDDLYKRYNSHILQHYHSEEKLLGATQMECVKKIDVELFSDRPDKRIYLFKNI